MISRKLEARRIELEECRKKVNINNCQEIQTLFIGTFLEADLSAFVEREGEGIGGKKAFRTTMNKSRKYEKVHYTGSENRPRSKSVFYRS